MLECFGLNKPKMQITECEETVAEIADVLRQNTNLTSAFDSFCVLHAFFIMKC